ncbi:MAG: pimeloyl-ACP methyl ester esterase BioH [Gammaproteobacteria bacterium]|nr:pimeloyl-ACP methyl ester esterase BioH [Gammaproteobacteria bacterium]
MKNQALSVTQSGRGEAVILLHGWGMNAAVFEPLRVELARNNRVYCVDLPGYGSSRWDADLSFTDQVALVASSLPAGRLLGWSMGGLYATQLAQQYAGQFSQLTLVCCNPCFVRREDWDCAVDEAVFDAFGEALNRGWKSTVKRFLTLQMHGNDNARQLTRELMAGLETTGEPNIEALLFGLNLLKQNDSRPLLASLDLPIKMILGGRDILVPHNLAKEIVHINPRIQVESLAFAAHAPFLSHTDQFLTML